MATTRVEFDEQTYETLKQEAARRGISLPQLLRKMAEEFAPPQTSPEDATASLLAFVGSGRSGLGDLSEHHDQYFAATRAR
jgi:hypothetical protein